MELPPVDSPVWAQMEEDAAAGRRQLPFPFPFWLYPGPRNELKRRNYFKSLLKSYRRPLGLHMLLFWGLFSARTNSRCSCFECPGLSMDYFGPLPAGQLAPCSAV
jgi:hypothetical protein